MKKRSADKRKDSRRKPLKEPKVVTYERDELVTKTVFAQGTSDIVRSNRNLKRNCRPENSKKVARKLASFEKPEVVTYERDELDIQTVFAQIPNGSLYSSDRNLKNNFKPVNSKKTAKKLASFEKPEVVTYERDELAAEKSFVVCQSIPDSDRNLKKNFRPVNSKRIARKLASFEKPKVITYERDELIAKTVFTAVTNTSNFSDRNLKKNFRPVSAKKIARKLTSFEKPEVVTYERDELASERPLVVCQGSATNPN